MDRENAVGFILLGVCGVLAVFLVFAIANGERLTFSGPGWLGTAIVIVGFLLLFFGMFRGIRDRMKDGGSSPHWPDPTTGRRSWWDRLRERLRGR